jgi:hypothetical protein
LTSLAEVRAAVNEIAAAAQRLISIYTPDLEPDLYDQTAFLDVIKHFVLTRSFSKVRVLLAEPTRVMRDSNRFVAMGRRLSSCIDIRYVAAQSPQRASSYLIADDRAIVYRMRAGRRTRLSAGVRPGLERQRGRAWPAGRPSRLSLTRRRRPPTIPTPTADRYNPPHGQEA